MRANTLIPSATKRFTLSSIAVVDLQVWVSLDLRGKCYVAGGVGVAAKTKETRVTKRKGWSGIEGCCRGWWWFAVVANR